MANEFIDNNAVFRKNLKTAGLCVIKTLICGLMTFIIFASITMMAVSLGTRAIGYTVYHSTDNAHYTEVYTYYFSKEPDKQQDKYAGKEGYTRSVIKSELGKGTSQVIALISQVLGLIIFVSMLYGTTWKLGDGDENKVSFGHMKKDLSRGFKIGMWTALPYSLVWLLLLLSKMEFVWSAFPIAFKYLNYHYFFIIDLFLGSATKTGVGLSWGGTLLSLLLLIPIPLILALGYIAGYRHFSLKEKIVYKKPTT